MPYVNGGKYLDSPLTYGIRAASWTPLSFLNYNHAAFTEAEWAAYYDVSSPNHSWAVNEARVRYIIPPQGVVPYVVYGDWHQANVAERYRYEYELDWATFPPSCLWVVGVGSWGGASYSSGNFNAGFVPADGTDPFPQGYYILGEQSQSWASVQQWLNAIGIPVQDASPQPVTISLRLSGSYKVYEFFQGLSSRRSLVGTISFQQSRDIHWTIYDYPQPFIIFSDMAGECQAVPGHVHAGSDVLSAVLTWQNDVAPDHQTYGWMVEAWGVNRLRYWTGAVPAGGTGRQQVTFQHTAREILGRDPVAGESFKLTGVAGLNTRPVETDRVEFTFQVEPLPAPNPDVSVDKCTCSKSYTTGILPNELATFNVTIHRNTPNHNQYQTTDAYIGVTCKGHTQVLWTGTFPGGAVTEMVRSFKLSPDQLAGAATGDEVIVPVFFAGNGKVYNSADLDVYWVPNNGQGLSVQPLYNTPHGVVEVQSSPPGASFTISGPVSLGGMTPYTSQDVPVGQYTITWGAMVGYTKPRSVTQVLLQDGTITFSGTYTTGDDGDGDGDGEGAGPSTGLILLGMGGAAAIALAIRRLKGRK